jgi:hypothetical protein
MTFDEAMKLGEWTPIRDCAGRFVLRGVSETMSVASLLGEGVQIQMFESPKARDTVFVVRFEGGGTISYRQSRGSWLHTLCTEEGFRRKLEQLQITLTEPSTS